MDEDELVALNGDQWYSLLQKIDALTPDEDKLTVDSLYQAVFSILEPQELVLHWSLDPSSPVGHDAFSVVFSWSCRFSVPLNKGRGRMQRTFLHFAAEKNFKKVTKFLMDISGDIDVNVKDSTGCTPLHLACSEGSEEITKSLLEHPDIEVNVKDSTQCTPLLFACRQGFEEITKLLLLRPEIDVNAADTRHITPLHFAAFRGIDGAVSLLVQHPDIDLYSRTAHEEMTALHMAACQGDANIVRMILDAESRDCVDVEETVPLVMKVDRLKRTPLHYAAYEQRLDVVKELLQSPGLDFNIGDDRSFTALHLAVLRGHVTIVQLLLNQQNINLNIVTECISENDLERVRGWQEDVDGKETPCPRLIDYIPFQKVAGMTALHCALELVEVELATEDCSMEGMMGVVNVLLAHPNIDINIVNENGESPLHVALRRKLGPILLRLFGKHEDMVDPCVHLLRSYCKEGNLDMSIIDPVLEKLHASLDRLNLKIDVGKFDTLPLTHKAAIVGKEELLSVLVDIQQLGDINAEDGEKRTPLHYATIAGQMKSVKLLLMNPGLRANHEDLYNKTALQIAFETEQKDIEKQLLEKPEVKDWLDRVYRDRQLYSDAANAILVGAALIAGVTYGGWLQPPLGYTPYYEFPVSDPAPPDTYQVFAAVKQHVTVRIFWVCNNLSFFLAIAAVLSGAAAVLPMSDVFIAEEVRTLRRYLLVTALLVMFAIIFVLGGFAAAGFASLPPILNLEMNMIISSVIAAYVGSGPNYESQYSHDTPESVSLGEAYGSTIHQPSSLVLHRLDETLFLSEYTHSSSVAETRASATSSKLSFILPSVGIRQTFYLTSPASVSSGSTLAASARCSSSTGALEFRALVPLLDPKLAIHPLVPFVEWITRGLFEGLDIPGTWSLNERFVHVSREQKITVAEDHPPALIRREKSSSENCGGLIFLPDVEPQLAQKRADGVG
ncbi:hypothetical protein R1sor_020476 [Riccia sorocarpa]|uniref:PGG domain-containing protein n=1 Tax=Riccia sorocarpa TaxID=122646 RepID=A0ABD3ILR0_9MARC